MRRDPHSKAIIFPVDPNKKAQKEMTAKVAHHSDEIQFLADCINYQQNIIEEQKKTIEDLTSGTAKAAKAPKTSK